MAETKQVEIAGTNYAYDGRSLENLDVEFPDVQFPKVPIWEKSNPAMQSYTTGRVGYEAEVAAALPFASRIAALVSGAVPSLIAQYKGWNWVSVAVYESPTQIPVRFWWDKHIYKIEFVLAPPVERALGGVLVGTAAVLFGIAAVLTSIGLLTGRIRIKDLASPMRWGAIGLIALAAFMFFYRSPSKGER